MTSAASSTGMPHRHSIGFRESWDHPTARHPNPGDLGRGVSVERRPHGHHPRYRLLALAVELVRCVRRTGGPRPPTCTGSAARRRRRVVRRCDLAQPPSQGWLVLCTGWCRRSCSVGTPSRGKSPGPHSQGTRTITAVTPTSRLDHAGSRRWWSLRPDCRSRRPQSPYLPRGSVRAVRAYRRGGRGMSTDVVLV